MSAPSLIYLCAEDQAEAPPLDGPIFNRAKRSKAVWDAVHRSQSDWNRLSNTMKYAADMFVETADVRSGDHHAPIGSGPTECPAIEIAPGFRMCEFLGHFGSRRFYENLNNTHQDAVERYFEAVSAGTLIGSRIRHKMVYVEILRCCFASALVWLLSKVTFSVDGRAE